MSAEERLAALALRLRHAALVLSDAYTDQPQRFAAAVNEVDAVAADLERVSVPTEPGAPDAPRWVGAYNATRASQPVPAPEPPYDEELAAAFREVRGEPPVTDYQRGWHDALATLPAPEPSARLREALEDVADAARAHADMTHVGTNAQVGLSELRAAVAALDDLLAATPQDPEA